MADDTSSTVYQDLGDSVFFGPVQIEQLDRIHALEAASYPADEAATYDKLKFRIQNAPGAFLVALQCRTGDPDGMGVVGYCCGTCTSAGGLTHESMAAHDPDGSLLCIHSVCVEAGMRRRGLATRLLRAFVPYVRAGLPHVTGVRLLCKQDLVGLYEGAGFRLLGPSDVVHGQDQWLEMALELEGDTEEGGANGGVAADAA